MIDQPLERPAQPWDRAAAAAGLSVETGDDGVAVVEFDEPGGPHNRLTPELLERLGAVLDDLRRQAAQGSLEGVVFASAKPDSFIAGVDVAAIAAIRDEAAATATTRRGQEIFEKIAELGVPTLAAINGTCLGGATEMALACTRRLAADSPAVEIGLPEVNLGIFPGFGGTQRLPRTISLERALPMILAGKPVDARKARRIGLIDAVVPAPLLLAEARRQVLPPLRGRRRAPDDRGALRVIRRWLLEGQPLGRALILRQARRSVLSRGGGHYPAPLRALETIRRGLRMPLADALALEAAEVGKLVVSPVARNLIGIFFSRQAARRAARDGELPGVRRSPPRPVDKLAVVGAGVMGGGIAQVAAYSGIRVRLKDVVGEALTAGLEVAHERFEERRRAGRLSAAEVARGLGLISPTLQYTGFGTADLVIEAVVERLDVKRTVLAEIEAVVAADAVLATNTSSLTLAAMGAGLQRPQRLVGLHFFNPVHRMPLVEVVRGERSDPQALATAAAFAQRLGKVPVIVADAPGFFVNRVLTPYLNEALLLLEAGAGIARIDAALRGFGMPMGPLRLLDEIGLDISDHVATAIAPLFGDRLPAASATKRLRESGRLGRKNGRGFYRHGSGKPEPDPEVEAMFRGGGAPPAGDEIVDRCVLLMLNETCRALAEGIVASPRLADLALVMGTGFAPFRGGILRYADESGLAALTDRMRALAERLGPRFAPAERLAETAAEGSFYGADWPAP